MNYSILNNDCYVVVTSKGMKTFDKYHLNFSKLVDVITSTEPSEKEFLKLMVQPQTPNGVYTAYEEGESMVLFYSITKDTTEYYSADGNSAKKPSALTFLGVYASLQELMEDNAPYLI